VMVLAVTAMRASLETEHPSRNGGSSKIVAFGLLGEASFNNFNMSDCILDGVCEDRGRYPASTRHLQAHAEACLQFK
jgi:hypothetical protein